MAATFLEKTLSSKDGTALNLQCWSPTEGDGTPKASVLVLHGYADHAARYRELAHHLCTQGITVHALSYRGHGKSGGARGYVEHFVDYHDDLAAGFESLPTDRPRFVLAHSHGGLILLDYIQQRQPNNFDGVILSNPFLDLAMAVPPIKVKAAEVMARIYGKFALPSGIDPENISHDKEIVSTYARDPLVFKTATAGWFVRMRQVQARVRTMRDCPAPVLYIYSDSDPIASPTANAAVAEQLTQEDKEIVVRHGELHEVLNETDRKALHEKIGQWILAHL